MFDFFYTQGVFKKIWVNTNIAKMLWLKDLRVFGRLTMMLLGE